MTFFPVDRRIFTSSLWLTGTPEERCLWWWLLGNKDDDGVVRHRELAITDGAKLPRPVVEEALRKFSEPDAESRTRDNDGRRIERTPEGYVRILNHELYYSTDYSTPRWRRWKDRQRANALARLPTPLATKDKDKDKDKEEKREGSRGVQGGRKSACPSLPSHGNGRKERNGREPVSEETATALLKAAADVVALQPESLTVARVIEEASRIEASNGRGARCFTDPRAKGIGEPWAKTTLRKIEELRQRVSARLHPPL